MIVSECVVYGDRKKRSGRKRNRRRETDRMAKRGREIDGKR